MREAALKYRVNNNRIIDFSANINPLGLSPRVKKALISGIDTALHYPDPYCEGLKKKLASSLGVGEKNILIGNGSCDLIYLIPRVLTPQKVLIPVPTFAEYEYAVDVSKGMCKFLFLEEAEGFSVNPEYIIDNIKKMEMVFICNPQNPIGNVMKKEELISVVSQCEKRGVKVIVDEAFIDFVQGYDYLSLVKDAVSRENLLVLRSLTKFFGIPGLRVGYLVGEEGLITEISSGQAPWMVNTLGQIAAEEALEDLEYIERSRIYVCEEREYLFSELKRITGIDPFPSAVNFIFCKLTLDEIDSILLDEKLGRRGVLIRDCSTFRGLDRRFIRLAVRKREENIRLISILQEVLGTEG